MMAPKSAAPLIDWPDGGILSEQECSCLARRASGLIRNQWRLRLASPSPRPDSCGACRRTRLRPRHPYTFDGCSFFRHTSMVINPEVEMSKEVSPEAQAKANAAKEDLIRKMNMVIDLVRGGVSPKFAMEIVFGGNPLCCHMQQAVA